MANGRTIYLHIGTEKTGTTTLQAMFARNRQLLAQRGVLYPTTPGHANLAGLAIFALPMGNRPDLYSILRLSTATEVETYREQFVAKFSSELDTSPCKDIVMSSEHLSSRVRQPQALARLFDMLRTLADTIKVIVYLRPQHELAPSSYSTSVKSGNSKPFHLPESDRAYFYNYDLLTRNWEHFVGRENMVVRLFSKAAFKENSLIADVFDAMSVEKPIELFIPSDKNKALAANALEFLRVANTIVPRRLGNHVNPEQMALVKLLTERGATPKFEIDREASKTIESMFLASNQSVAERYFPELNGRLFPPARAAENVAGLPTPEELIRIGVELWQAGRGSDKATLAHRVHSRPKASD